MELHELNEKIRNNYFTVICSLKKEENEKEIKWIFRDCDDKIIRTPDGESIFPSSMFKRYKNKYSGDDFFEDKSRVWVLVGITAKKHVHWLQVGRNNNRTNMLSNDIVPDVAEFLLNDGKYGEYRNKYDNVIFLEVNIDNYLEEFKQYFGDTPKKFVPAYYCLLAAYVEAKFAYDTKAEKYKTSTLDGYFYNELNGNVGKDKNGNKE